MAKALFIPGADRTSLWFGDRFDGLIQGELDKLVLHSTETNKRWGCPGYQGGGTAPTVTINPWTGYQKTWQHFQADESARALLNPATTPVSENKDNVAQVEIIGYSDIKLGRAAGCYLPDLSDTELAYLATVLRWYHEEWGIRLVAPPTWPIYQVSSEKDFAAARMTSTEYDRYAGVLAHLHVSGNAHRDVALNITKLLALAGGEDDSMSAAEVQEIKDHINAVALYGYYEKGKPGKQPSLLEVLAETQRRVTVGAADVKALTSGMASAVAAAVTQAVAATDGPLPDADVERIATAAAEKFAEGFEVDLKPVTT